MLLCRAWFRTDKKQLIGKQMAKEKKIKSKRPKAEPPKGFRDYFGDEINKCLENTEQEQVLLKSPHFCKKVYHYLMKPEII